MEICSCPAVIQKLICGMVFFYHWSIIVLLLLKFWWIFPCQISQPHHPRAPIFARTVSHQSVSTGTWLGSWWRWKHGRTSPGAANLNWLCCRSSFSGMWWSELRATPEPFRLFPRMNICQCIKWRDSILEAVFCALSLAHLCALESGLDRRQIPKYHWSDCSRRCLYCLLLWGEI